ncbi:MAG TPA: pitrilysin family protein [Virgibacillus sp.]|nr:pitrilysin family protein [Virgibacillus sp.]
MKKQFYKHINETIYKDTLDNGLTVFLLPRRDMEKTFGIFSTEYGSIDQTFVPIGANEEITVPEGVAHFLEHKLFEKEDRDVFADFSKQGASANAYTSFTNTAYLFSATANIEKNIETLLDFVQDPYFSKESVEKEKGIIAQEIMMYDDQPQWQSFMGTMKSLYHHHPVNIDIAGTVESIQTITENDLYVCYNTFYHPENMTLFVAGNFDPEQTMTLIKNNQRKKEFPPMNDIKRKFPDEPMGVAMKEHTIVMPVSIPRCTVGIKEMPSDLSAEQFLKKDLLQSMILDHYFSKGGSFYQQLYEDNLIDDSFSFSTTLEKTFGYSMIGGNTNKPDKFAETVTNLLLSTKNTLLSTKDIQKMKNKQIGQLLRGMNSLEFIANNYIQYHSYGLDFLKIIDSIQTLSEDDFQKFTQEWINEDQLTVCKIVSEE